MKIYAISYGIYKGCYEDSVIKPMQAGAALVDTQRIAIKDNVGLNISADNQVFNELTAIFSIWKNQVLQDDYIGVCHYRRYFTKANVIIFFMLRTLRLIPGLLKTKRWLYKYFISRTTTYLINQRHNWDLILPSKIKIPCTMQEHYSKYHCAAHYQVMLEIIDVDFPYLSHIATECSNAREGYFFNSFIMTSDLFQRFCSELFRFTELAREKIESSEHANESRYIGFLAERFSNCFFNYLINVEKLNYSEIDMLVIDNESFYED